MDIMAKLHVVKGNESLYELIPGRAPQASKISDEYAILDIKEELEEFLKLLESKLQTHQGVDKMKQTVYREELDRFKEHIDSKFDRIIDKVDENRRELKEDMKHQTMVTISVISAIITVVGVLVPVILHFI